MADSAIVDTVKITKQEAASRQLDSAIQMLFAGVDIVAVHTLAGAASNVASDLIERERPEKSWDLSAREVCGLDKKIYLQIMRATQNFLKHANVDPHNTHEFAIGDTLALLASAVFNMAELSNQLTIPQSVYQLWYLAYNLDVLDESFEHRSLIKSVFGNLNRRTIHYQLAVGRRELQDAIRRNSVRPTARV